MCVTVGPVKRDPQGLLAKGPTKNQRPRL